MDKLQLDFDKHFILNIFGMCLSGKSHALKYILYYYAKKKKYDHMLLFTNTSFNNQYDYIPKQYIHPAYDEEVIKNYMELQRNYISEGKQSSALIVFDDCLGKMEHFASKEFLTLITQYRQFKISIIICSQSVSAIPLNIRNLAQYAIIFRFEAERVIKSCFESFGVLCNNWHEFKDLLIKATSEKYRFLFYDRMKSIEGKEKAYKSMKCPGVENFKLDF
jgi:hypothetical protein